ncbi:MAG: HAD family hydrolase [Nanoarchaeota archaeon]
MKNIKAILFDMDGVLIDTGPSWFHVFNLARVHFGFPEVDLKDWQERCWGLTLPAIKDTFFPGITEERLLSSFESKMHLYFKHALPMPHSVNVINRLKKKFKIAVVTNGTKKMSDLLLPKLGITFDAVLTSDDGAEKPSPDLIIKACELLQVAPKDTVMIGDVPVDMEAAKAAGCIGIGFGIDGDYRVESFLELLKLLGEHHGPL